MASFLVCSLIFIAFPLQITAQTYTNITLGSSLTANDRNVSWTSPSGDFAFGFQQLPTGGFLLATWFDQVLPKTIFWSANRDKPAPEGSKIELSGSGLVLSDPQGTLIWSWTLTWSGVTYAAMLDTGNFVLASQEGGNVWETFQNPTDTMLPTQILDKGKMLVSSYSSKSYSSGRFQLRLQNDGNLVLSVRAFPTNDTYGDYWESNTVDSGYQLIFNQTGKIYLTAENETMLTPMVPDSLSTEDLYQRAVLDYDGVFRKYSYPKTTISRNGGLQADWTLRSDPIPGNICSAIAFDLGGGACGLNSYCVIEGEQQRPQCKCPKGYTYVDPENEINGCAPAFELQSCSVDMPEADQFTFDEMSSTNWPFSDYERLDIDEHECRKSCLNDCLCYLAVLGRRYCWKKRMPFSNGQMLPDEGGTRSLIKVRKFNSTSRQGPMDGRKENDDGSLILIGSILLSTSGAMNLVLIFVILLIWFRPPSIRKAIFLQSSFPDESTPMLNFTYQELKEATNEFKEEIGKGAFGVVYKGVISSTCGRKSLIAVKVLYRLTETSDREFKAEVNTIGRTNHKNLVQLIGFCNEGQNCLLVYEFMEKGSLGSYLFGVTPRPSWYKRVEIACGVGRGLLYLHEECCKQVIHCDIKPQNILLDTTLTAKISDFDLAKLLMTDQTQTVTGIRGKKGYLAPEWFRNMPISVKVDVYSFGVLLLEFICCRKNCELEMEEQSQMVLSDWVYDCYQEGMLHLLVQGDDEAQNDMKRVERFAMTAMWCIQEDPSTRPPMKKIMQMLEGEVDVSAPPFPSSFNTSI